MSDNSITIKTRLSALIHNKQTLNAVRTLVIDFNIAAKAAWLFARWIFLAELKKNPDWDPASCITQTFFSEVLHACIDCKRGTARVGPTLQARELIAQHQVAFFQTFPFNRPTIASPQQLCHSQATKMVTAYHVNIKLRLGNHIRHHINHLGERKRYAHLAKKRTKCNVDTKLDAKARIQRLNRYVDSIKLGQPDATDLPQLLPLQQVVAATFSRGTLPPQGFWYDISADPIKYLKTMIDLSRLNLKTFQVFPISTQWKPLYVFFDLKIVVMSALKGREGHEYKEAAADPATWWTRHVRTNKRPWKAQAGRGFTRSFQTDGIAVSVYKSKTVKAVRGKSKTEEEREQKKQELATNRKRKRDEGGATLKKHKPNEKAEFPYITDIEPTKLIEDKGNTVLIDPGRGDLLYCMHENSTPTSKQLYRYTADQRRNELKIKLFREACSPKPYPDAKAQMNAIARTSHRHTSLERFTEYLAARSTAAGVLTPFFAKEVHRETRWQSYRLQQQSNARLSNNIRRKFGEDPLLVIGDHSSPNMRFQQSIRGVGMLRMLKQHKFRILLVDEYKTSKICPGCDQVNRCFRWRCNPRPWMQNVREVHGLKQCDGCGAGSSTKPWNRDLVATLNFRRIVQAQREGRARPEILQRKREDRRELVSSAFRDG